MKRVAFLVAGLLLISTTAIAGANWQSTELSTSLGNAPKLLAAFDKLMDSVAGDLTGTVSLMANVAGGSGSHVVISSFDSRAAREAWLAKLQASKAWAQFGKDTAGIIEARGTSRMNFLKSWGTESDKDVFWEIHAFTVTDLAAFTSAIDEFLGSETGKKFQGQVHLSAVVAAGMSSATHLIGVGHESEAAAEAWGDAIASSADLTSYLKASRKAGTVGGTFYIRSIKSWGNTGE